LSFGVNLVISTNPLGLLHEAYKPQLHCLVPNRFGDKKAAYSV
jgi:hypothetical protein